MAVYHFYAVREAGGTRHSYDGTATLSLDLSDPKNYQDFKKILADKMGLPSTEGLVIQSLSRLS